MSPFQIGSLGGFSGGFSGALFSIESGPGETTKASSVRCLPEKGDGGGAASDEASQIQPWYCTQTLNVLKGDEFEYILKSCFGDKIE